MYNGSCMNKAEINKKRGLQDIQSFCSRIIIYILNGVEWTPPLHPLEESRKGKEMFSVSLLLLF